MSRQHAILYSVVLMLVLVISGPLRLATGADYPTKPITLIVPFPPGGGADTIGRPLASVAHQHLGQPMVVLNKAGGGGAVGTQFVANAKPDGYTLLYSLNTISEMPHIDTLLGRPLSFKKEQFIPIGQVTVTPFAIMVNAESPWKTFPEFVAEAKQKPEAFQYASAGVYSTTHIMWERMLLATGIGVRHMPTTGGGPIMTAVLGKHVDIGHCVVPTVCGPQVAAGKIRLLVVTSEERHPVYPDVPTLRELGYDVTHSIWHVLMAPAGTPPEIVGTLRKALKSMVEDDAFKALLEKLGERVRYMSGEDFEKFWEQDYQQVGEILRQIVKHRTD
jgi:tripartite-type tricarboxylate transporter receptor subunit TctC